MKQCLAPWLAVTLMVGCGKPATPDGTPADASAASADSQFEVFERLTDKLELPARSLWARLQNRRCEGCIANLNYAGWGKILFAEGAERGDGERSIERV